MSVLSDFRANPEKTMEKADFMVDATGYPVMPLPLVTNCQYGGPCSLKEVKDSGGVTRLKVGNGGSDYFFPWVNRGVGEVKVSKGVPDGTIVVTGGMNGCSLVVTDTGTHYVFYHDADSRYLGAGPQFRKDVEGNRVCAVGPRTYDPLSIGYKIADDARFTIAYFSQLMIVKHGGRWKVFNSGILHSGGLKTKVESTYRPTITKLLTSF
jgi:hypothetical protein